MSDDVGVPPPPPQPSSPSSTPTRSCVTWCRYSGGIPEKTDPNSRLVTWEMEMATFSNWFRNQVLGIFEGNAPQIPTQFYIACHSTVSTPEQAGSELSGSGYARTPITFTRVSDIKRWNPDLVGSPAATAVWSQIRSMSIWDSLTGGHYYAYGNLTAGLSVTTGNQVVWPAESVIIGLGSQL